MTVIAQFHFLELIVTAYIISFQEFTENIFSLHKVQQKYPLGGSLGQKCQTGSVKLMLCSLPCLSKIQLISNVGKLGHT